MLDDEVEGVASPLAPAAPRPSLRRATPPAVSLGDCRQIVDAPVGAWVLRGSTLDVDDWSTTKIRPYAPVIKIRAGTELESIFQTIRKSLVVFRAAAPAEKRKKR